MKTFAFFAAVLACGVAEAKDIKNTFTVTGWECKGCANKTAKALLQIDGVKTATPDLAKGQITVAYDDGQVKSADIEAAIKKLKFGCEDDK